jgi:hypothetical protein
MDSCPLYLSKGGSSIAIWLANDAMILEQFKNSSNLVYKLLLWQKNEKRMWGPRLVQRPFSPFSESRTLFANSEAYALPVVVGRWLRASGCRYVELGRK